MKPEYYTGLDICRGAIIWLFLAREAGFRELSFWKKVRMVFLQWLPYLGVLGAFMFWRVFVFQFPSYQPVLLETFSKSPLNAIREVAFRIVEDAYTATWGAWTEFFKFPNHTDLETASGKVFWLAVMLSLIAVLIAAFLYRSEARRKQKHAVGQGISFVIRGKCQVDDPRQRIIRLIHQRIVIREQDRRFFQRRDAGDQL